MLIGHSRAPSFSARVALALVVIVGCTKGGSEGPSSSKSDPAGQSILDHYQAPVVQLRGNAVTLPNELQDPSSIAVGGNALWILDQAGRRKTALTVDATSGKLLGALAASDSSRIEGAWSFAAPRKRDVGIWIFDARDHKLLLIDRDRSSEGRLSIKREIALQSQVALTSPEWRDDTTIISPGFLPQGRLAVFDSTGRLRTTLGSIPQGAAKLPARVIQHAYQSSLAANSTQTRFVLANRYADRLEILSADGTLEKVAQRPFGFDPVFKVVSTRSGPIADLEAARFGYVDVIADDRHIFALFSGKLSRRYHGRENYGRYIHVFDWSGNLLRVGELDQEAITIALDPASAVLYAVGGPPDPQVKRYSLANLIVHSAR